jgi:NAD(P)-dependent dehydrogenase (short-subunit alcohol dehydrogenase family)
MSGNFGSIRFDGKVAIVTGSGGGLGREYALELARRGAKVVINDLGGSRDGTGHSDAALKVVEEIEAAGGTALSNGGSVTDYDQMVEMVARATEAWGGVHILINNAGVLRDKSFAKMEPADFKFVVDVHLGGSANATKAVWDAMRAQNYGRILMTASSTGLYGNFGQANYGAAKLGLAGLTKTLAIEGAKNNIRVNMIVGAGAGVFQAAYVTLTQGALLTGDDLSAEGVAAHWDSIIDRAGEIVPQSGSEQSMTILTKLQGR